MPANNNEENNNKNTHFSTCFWATAILLDIAAGIWSVTASKSDDSDIRLAGKVVGWTTVVATSSLVFTWACILMKRKSPAAVTNDRPAEQEITAVDPEPTLPCNPPSTTSLSLPSNSNNLSYLDRTKAVHELYPGEDRRKNYRNADEISKPEISVLDPRQSLSVSTTSKKDAENDGSHSIYTQNHSKKKPTSITLAKPTLARVTSKDDSELSKHTRPPAAIKLGQPAQLSKQIQGNKQRSNDDSGLAKHSKPVVTQVKQQTKKNEQLLVKKQRSKDDSELSKHAKPAYSSASKSTKILGKNEQLSSNRQSWQDDSNMKSRSAAKENSVKKVTPSAGESKHHQGPGQGSPSHPAARFHKETRHRLSSNEAQGTQQKKPELDIRIDKLRPR